MLQFSKVLLKFIFFEALEVCLELRSFYIGFRAVLAVSWAWFHAYRLELIKKAAFFFPRILKSHILEALVATGRCDALDEEVMVLIKIKSLGVVLPPVSKGVRVEV